MRRNKVKEIYFNIQSNKWVNEDQMSDILYIHRDRFVMIIYKIMSDKNKKCMVEVCFFYTNVTQQNIQFLI